ncbi:hypothetical protein [Methanosarcina sp. UBA411]|mgnify:CR=1 FL=1|jgi:hypothetical protein|uniref:hypothetical protein n=1 Tax=Methanosarcina sp. UBA411 TaxID=1915589 RepID=UPI0025E5324F|nr:hypothetical protein [Methanosarcina sp. UBA411]
MLNKKVLLSILIIGAVVATAGAATWATLEDTSISNDQITAGTLTLDETAISPVTIDKVAPGDYGTETQTVTIGGNLDGLLTIDVDNVVFPPAANDTAPEPHTSLLSNNFEVNIKLTDNNDGLIKYVAGSEDTYVLLTDSLQLAAEPVTSGSTYKIVTSWRIKPEADNGIQGQSLSFTEAYKLNSRNGIDKS